VRLAYIVYLYVNLLHSHVHQSAGLRLESTIRLPNSAIIFHFYVRFTHIALTFAYLYMSSTHTYSYVNFIHIFNQSAGLR